MLLNYLLITFEKKFERNIQLFTSKEKKKIYNFFIVSNISTQLKIVTIFDILNHLARNKIFLDFTERKLNL